MWPPRAGAVVGGVKSYAETGKVDWKQVAVGAGIGLVAGATLGAGTAFIATGSALASAGLVVTNISVATVTGGGSIWAVDKFVRGRILERILGGMNNNFPVIDKFVRRANGIAKSITSIKSTNLFCKTYQTGRNLYNLIMNYAAKLSNFEDVTWNRIKVNVDTSTRRILEIAIPRGATPEQVQQMKEATVEAAKQGVEIIFRQVQ